VDTRPVGIFDSGLGGLSVYRAFRALAPAENVVYFADTDYFPYGPRPSPEIRKRSFAVARRLIRADCKLVIVACNTASAAALADLREAFSFVPFVGMVPGLKPAAAASPARHVAVLATPGTMNGDLYARVRDDFGRDVRIEHIEADGLADLVERGEAGTESAAATLRATLGPAVAAGADTVVLGCTHYNFLADDIAGLYPGIAILDTSEAVARRAVAVLDEEGLRNPDGEGSLRLIVTGNREEFFAQMERLGFPRSAGEERP
jgi:glutamate racemase